MEYVPKNSDTIVADTFTPNYLTKSILGSTLKRASEMTPANSNEERCLSSADSSLISKEEIIQALYDYNDGDARLFKKLNKGEYLHDLSVKNVKEDNYIYRFNGIHWTPDTRREVMVSGIQKLIDVYVDFRMNFKKIIAISETSDEQATFIKKLLDKRIKKLRSKSGKAQIIDAACMGEDSLTIEHNQWNQNPLKFACKNGIINLETGNLESGTPSDYINMASPVEYKGLDTASPAWLSFINSLFNNDQEIINFMQRLLGYCLTGLNCERKFVILHGRGQNGKGTLVKAISNVMGDYSIDIRSDLLKKGKRINAESSTSGLMRFWSRRFVNAAESDIDNKYDIPLLKRLSGGDDIVGRENFGNETQFTLTSKLFIQTNFLPNFSAHDNAIWERIIAVPFNLSFVDNPTKSYERESEKELSRKLRDESSGILSWLVKGAMDYLKTHKLNPPKSLQTHIKKYRKNQDLIDKFISECCIRDENKSSKAKDLYHCYKEWCNSNKFLVDDNKEFSRKIQENYKRKSKSDGNYYLGLFIKSDCT